MHRCRICHREITDPLSIRIGIGESVCRPRIEAGEGCGPELWDTITQEQIDKLVEKYTLYPPQKQCIEKRSKITRPGFKRHKARFIFHANDDSEIFEKESETFGRLRVRVFNDSEFVLIYENVTVPRRCTKKEAREIWKKWSDNNAQNTLCQRRSNTQPSK